MSTLRRLALRNVVVRSQREPLARMFASACAISA
jgi:hypothetical protein